MLLLAVPCKRRAKSGREGKGEQGVSLGRAIRENTTCMCSTAVSQCRALCRTREVWCSTAVAARRICTASAGRRSCGPVGRRSPDDQGSGQVSRSSRERTCSQSQSSPCAIVYARQVDTRQWPQTGGGNQPRAGKAQIVGTHMDCYICFERVYIQGVVCATCRHTAHARCLVKWGRSCGVCRTKVQHERVASAWLHFCIRNACILIMTHCFPSLVSVFAMCVLFAW